MTELTQQTRLAHYKIILFFISDTACVKFMMEIETDSDISEQHVKTAITFGFGSSEFPRVEAEKYIIAFMKRLLLHNEKLNKNLLESYLNPVIAKLWQDVLSTLEDTNWKLINIHNGSLIFTLFCPKVNSLQQLKDEKWRIEVQAKVQKLLKALGMLQINYFKK